jgi:WD40 repeat protein
VAPNQGFVAVARFGLLYILDAQRGTLIRTIDTRLHDVQCLSLAEQSGRPIAVLTAKKGRAWTARLWDLSTGEEIQTKTEYGLTLGQEDKMLGALAVSETSDRVRFAFASKYSKVMVSDLPILRDNWAFPYAEWGFSPEAGDYVRSLAIGNLHNETVLAARVDRGGIVSWDFTTGTRKAIKLNAHAGAVEDLCFGQIHGQSALISGRSDGMIRFWTPSLDLLSEIDIGEPLTALVWINPDRLAVGSLAGVLVVEFS